MSIEQEAAEYARRHVGGMQPVETVGDKVRAAYIAGALAAREKAAQIAKQIAIEINNEAIAADTPSWSIARAKVTAAERVAARIREQGKEQDRG